MSLTVTALPGRRRFRDVDRKVADAVCAELTVLLSDPADKVSVRREVRRALRQLSDSIGSESAAEMSTLQVVEWIWRSFQPAISGPAGPAARVSPSTRGCRPRLCNSGRL